MKEIVIGASFFSNLIFPLATSGLPYVSPIAYRDIINRVQPQETILAKQTLDLTKRSPVKEVNNIFRDNILLILHYLKGEGEEFINNQKCHPEFISGSNTLEMLKPFFYQGKQVQHDSECKGGKVDWEKVTQPFEVEFTLKPKEIFAFHDKYLPEYEGKVTKTIPVEYRGDEEFKVVDGLYGNGVCHLATLINWAAQEAGLKTVALVNHDFLPVPEIPREYGVSIFYTGDGDARRQNLYITNSFDFPVEFKFLVDKEKVELKIVKLF